MFRTLQLIEDERLRNAMAALLLRKAFDSE